MLVFLVRAQLFASLEELRSLLSLRMTVLLQESSVLALSVASWLQCTFLSLLAQTFVPLVQTF